MQKIKNIKHRLWAVSVVLFSVYACGDVYVDYPFNTMERFTLKDAKGNDFQGVIHNNEILVYWPPFQARPAQITPTIVVAERATIRPGSGAEVAFTDQTVYTVTAQDGTTQSYTLKPIVRRPETTLEILNVHFEMGISYSLEIRGEYIDTLSAKITLIDSLTKERFPVDRKYFGIFGTTRMAAIFPYDNDAGIVPARWYHVEFTSDFYEQTFNAYYLNPSRASKVFSFTATADVSRTGVTPGGEISVTYRMSGESAKYFTGKFIDADLLYLDVDATATFKSDNGKTLVYEVPNDLPVGAKVRTIRINNSNFINGSGFRGKDNHIFRDVLLRR